MNLRAPTLLHLLVLAGCGGAGPSPRGAAPAAAPPTPPPSATEAAAPACDARSTLAIVESVLRGGAAEAAGVQPGDRLAQVALARVLSP